MIYPFLDWFIPAKIKKDQGAHQRARMFLISHLFGPFLGNPTVRWPFWPARFRPSGFTRSHCV
jgi:hypothetical protein